MAKNYHGQERDENDLRKLPEEKRNLIYKYAALPEYRHGTGCNCSEVPCQISKCPLNGPNYSKIADKLGIARSRVHVYLDDGYKEQYSGYEEKYYRGKGRKRKKEQAKTDEGKAVHSRTYKRYSQTEKGKENIFKWDFIASSCLMYRDLDLNRLSIYKKKMIKYFNDEFGAGIEEA